MRIMGKMKKRFTAWNNRRNAKKEAKRKIMKELEPYLYVTPADINRITGIPAHIGLAPLATINYLVFSNFDLAEKSGVVDYIEEMTCKHPSENLRSKLKQMSKINKKLYFADDMVPVYYFFPMGGLGMLLTSDNIPYQNVDPKYWIAGGIILIITGISAYVISHKITKKAEEEINEMGSYRFSL